MQNITSLVRSTILIPRPPVAPGCFIKRQPVRYQIFGEASDLPARLRVIPRIVTLFLTLSVRDLSTTPSSGLLGATNPTKPCPLSLGQVGQILQAADSRMSSNWPWKSMFSTSRALTK